MNCFLFIFMITLAVATTSSVYDLSYAQVVDLVDKHNSLKDEHIIVQEENHKFHQTIDELQKTLKDTQSTLEEATTNNNVLKSSHEQCDTELQNTKADLKSSQQELKSAKDRITRLENTIQMPTPEPTTPEPTTPEPTTSEPTTPEPTTPEPTTPEPTTPEPTTPATPLSDEDRVENCGVISSTNDESITASSIYFISWGTQKSRLYTKIGGGGWLPNFPFEGSWIQIDMGTKKTVRGIATQGAFHFAYWIKTYSISYKTSTSSSFRNVEQSGVKKIFQGNTDENTVVINNADITCRYIRIHPLTWNRCPAMRFDVLLC